ncbi:putative protein kinase UbiB [Planctomycetes bacterium Pan216]|uniref:ABC1 atypical kinase-like domain-containing protein n=1 Tax=Kolteria novifilia TaxID=2527975 RepID=A0A518B2U3_9BACT|nr:putative protein kinase UbiB [Planctomycetes bacterium Pan216]
MSLSGFNKVIRGTKRLAQVVRVLAKHGFRKLIVDSGLHRELPVGKELLQGEVEQEIASSQPTERRVRLVLEELGPTFIKLGQVLSTRPDLVPPRLAEEFKHLQGDCPKLEFALIGERLDEELGPKRDELFASIEEQPLAAGSMAQTHRALLRTGERVILKVLRPGIHDILAADMDVLSEIARFTESHFRDMGYSPTQVVREFTRELHREVDLVHEGKSTDRLAEYFRDDPDVHFPKVHWEATTKNLLTLEEIDGTLLSRLTPETLTRQERRRCVEIGTDAVFKQCLQFGFFHADPHPGNIFVLPGGRIAFIDCGMTGRIEKKTMYQLADLVAGVVTGNLEGVIRTTIALADTDPSLHESRPFREDTWEFISRFDGATFETLDMPGLLNDFFGLLREYRIQCPSDIVFLIKAMTTIQGVGRQVDPSFDAMSHLRPHVERLMKQRYGFAAQRERLQRSILGYVELLEEIPNDIRALVARLRRREFSISVEHKGLERLNDDTIERAARNVAFALVISGLTIGSSILILADELANASRLLTRIGFTGLIGAGVLIAVFLASNLRRSL